LSNSRLSMDEVDIFDAVIKWGKEEANKQKLDADKSDNLKAVLEDILPLIRFPCMTVNEIATRVAPANLLDQMELVGLFSICAIADETARKKMKSKYSTKPREGMIVKGSTILEKKYHKDLAKVMEKKFRLTLLYAGAQHGYDGGAFHAKCDGQGPTLTVVRVGQNVFGGYNGDSWSQSNNYGTGETFLYKLGTGLMKMIPHSTNHTYNGSGYGPTWGDGHDLYINTSMKSGSNSSNVSTYSIANGYSGTFTSSTFTGSSSFAVDEIEIFKVEWKNK